MTEKSIIITGGGTGKRMGAVVPKQFLPLKGKPILMHTIERFYAYDPACQLVVVIPQEQFAYWEELCNQFDFKINHELVAGGRERFYSVRNGLKKAVGKLIAVHDAVRPLVASRVIEGCFEAAQKHGAAVPVIALKESLRMITDKGSLAVDRVGFKTVQTPQCFDAELLKKAYEQAFNHGFTDDASVIEKHGVSIYLVEGNEENIKITTPSDLKMAECLMDDE